MIGSIVGSALSVGSALFGGRAKRKAAKKQAKIVAQMKADVAQRGKENEQWYQRRYNEDSTQRADAQQAMQLTRDAMNERYNRAAGSAVVSGASDESLAMQKAAANDVLGSTVGNIVVQGENRKGAIEGQYMANKDALAAEKAALDGHSLQIEGAKGQYLSDAIEGVATAATGFATAGGLDGLDKLFSKKEKNTDLAKS